MRINLMFTFGPIGGEVTMVREVDWAGIPREGEWVSVASPPLNWPYQVQDVTWSWTGVPEVGLAHVGDLTYVSLETDLEAEDVITDTHEEVLRVLAQNGWRES